MRDDIEQMEDVIDTYLKIFGNRWNLLILYELFNGPKRFNELKRSLEPISQTVLVRHLKTLESMKMINRVMVSDSPVSVCYCISEAGYTVTPSMISTYGWIIKHLQNYEDDEERV